MVGAAKKEVWDVNNSNFKWVVWANTHLYVHFDGFDKAESERVWETEWNGTELNMKSTYHKHIWTSKFLGIFLSCSLSLLVRFFLVKIHTSLLFTYHAIWHVCFANIWMWYGSISINASLWLALVLLFHTYFDFVFLGVFFRCLSFGSFSFVDCVCVWARNEINEPVNQMW